MARNRRASLLSRDNIVQLAALFVAIISVQLVYSSIVRPRAAQVEMENRVSASTQSGAAFVPKRNIYVIVKDYEQQICFTLLIWALFIILDKMRHVAREKNVFSESFVDIEPGERIIPNDALTHAKVVDDRLQEKPRLNGTLLPRVLQEALQRFSSTASIQDTEQSVRELAQTEADRLDSELSLLRYIAWAIPSVGFIGTVRGIGEALALADQAIKGDISGVTSALGLAFNSTLIALFLSIILMYFIHLLQSREESLTIDLIEYARENLLAVMKVPESEGASYSVS